MSGRRSAGLVMYRNALEKLEVFLVHPGGPIFANRDQGVWGIPKGLFDPGEEPMEVALREFHEETGQSAAACAAELEPPREPRFVSLGSIVQRGGKRVFAWAFEGDWPRGVALASNKFQLEWPPGSGSWVETAEVDRGEFFSIDAARARINPAQQPLLDRLLQHLAATKS